LDPHTARAHSHLALALFYQGRPEEAVPEGPLPTRGCAYRLTRRGTAS